MSTRNLFGQCQQCGGRFEFPAAAAGLTGECPHCGQLTDCLLAAVPEENPPVPTRAVIYSLVALVILVGGLIGALVALKRAQRLVLPPPEARTPARTPQPPGTNEPFADINFRVSPVTLETAAGTSLVYAQGTIVNLASHQRFGVKVDLDLFDAAGRRLAGASDYQRVIEPNAEWKFRALVFEPKGAFAKIAAIKETK